MQMVASDRIGALRAAAAAAQRTSYSRYSGLTVLAAVERSDGRVYGGANVEIVNFTLSKHAEETAALAAIADDALALGDKWLTAVYVLGALPCGSCRQFLWEWATPETVCLVDVPNPTGSETVRQFTLAQLLPEPFDASVLPDRRRSA